MKERKQGIRGFLAGVLTSALVLGAAASALALSSPETIQCFMGGVKIFIDGQLQVPTDVTGKVVEPIIYNGTTYLPVRALTGMLTDKSVEWDGDTESVYIGLKPGAGESTQMQDSDSAIYEHGLDVVSLMEEMASSEDYIGLMVNSPEVKAILSSLADGDRTKPKAVYKISISDDMRSAATELAGVDRLPDRLKEYLQPRMLNSVASLINGKFGMDAIAAASICAVEKTFVSGALTEDTAYLYTYEDAAPVYITFVMGEDGAISASGQFIIDADAVMSAPEEYGLLLEEVFTEETK